jgi:hypothetical protein
LRLCVDLFKVFYRPRFGFCGAAFGFFGGALFIDFAGTTTFFTAFFLVSIGFFSGFAFGGGAFFLLEGIFIGLAFTVAFLRV